MKSEEMETMVEKMNARPDSEKIASVISDLHYQKDNLTQILRGNELLKILKPLNEAEAQIRIASARIREQEIIRNK